MIRRRRGSLIGTAARTAIIAGTATSVSGKVARKQQEASKAAAKRAAPAGARTESDRLDELERLNALRKSGALTAREFDHEKAKILAD